MTDSRTLPITTFDDVAEHIPGGRRLLIDKHTSPVCTEREHLSVDSMNTRKDVTTSGEVGLVKR